MKIGWLFGLLALLAAAGLVRLALEVDVSDFCSADRVPPVLDRTVAQGVCLVQGLEEGGGRISFDSCRTEKRRLGFLAVGGCDDLFLDNLQVVLPAERHADKDSASAVDPVDPLTELLSVDRGFLQAQRLPLKFFGLHVSGLSVARLIGTNAVCRFTAHSGELDRRGLRLRECRIGGTNAVSGAWVTLKPQLALRWSCGEMKL